MAEATDQGRFVAGNDAVQHIETGNLHQLCVVVNATGDRQPFEAHREEENHDNTQPESRHRDAQKSSGHTEAINDGILLDSGNDPDGDSDCQAEEQSTQRQFDGSRQVLADQLTDGLALDVRIAQVSAHHTAQVDKELAIERVSPPQVQEKGLIQVELSTQVLYLVSRDVTRVAHHDVHRITRGQAHENEDYDGHTEHDGDSGQNTFQNFDSTHECNSRNQSQKNRESGNQEHS